MNVSELFSLTNWIAREIVGQNIPQKYQALYSILQQNSQPNQKQPFESQTADLVSSLTNVPLELLSRDQINFLDKLGILKTIGSDGVAAIEEILYRNAMDIATATQKVVLLHQQVSNGINKATQILTGLNGCLLEEEYEIKNEVLIRVCFTGGASMKNVVDFKSLGNSWHEIGRGIAMVHDAAPEDIKIVGATKGSIVIELAVAYGIAKTTSGILLEALKVAERVLDLKKRAEEIRGMKLKNDKIAHELEKEADTEKKSGIDEIAAKVAADLRIKTDGEKLKVLEVAVKNLVNFIENGGSLDFVLPEVSAEAIAEEEADKKELRVSFQQVRQLEKKLALLEYKKDKELHNQ
jgi:hypothetical protein